MIGFDTKDSKILSALKRNDYNTRALAEAIGLSRTTVAYRLKRMKAHHLVQERPSPGTQRVWGLSMASKQFKNRVQEYHGGSDIMRAHTMLFKEAPKNSTIYSIEGTAYSKLVNKTAAYKTMGANAHNAQQKRNIVLKSITHVKAWEDFARQNHSAHFLKLRQKHHISVKVLTSPSSLLGSCAFIFLPHYMSMIDEHKQYAIIIKNPPMTRVLYDMIALLYDLLDHSEHASRFDLHKLIDTLLAIKEGRIAKN